MITCPTCGTVNRAWASHCGECGKRLPDDARERSATANSDAAATRTERLPDWLRNDVEERPRKPENDAAHHRNALPAIPDGGLTEAMPSWLADDRHDTRVEPASLLNAGQRVHGSEETPDVTTFLSPEDLPAWLRRLAEMEPRDASPPDAQRSAPSATPIGPPAGDASAKPTAIDDRHASSAATGGTPLAPATQQPAVPVMPPPRDHSLSPTPAPSANGWLTAAILAGVVIAAALIAYAIYLGVSG